MIVGAVIATVCGFGGLVLGLLLGFGFSNMQTAQKEINK